MKELIGFKDKITENARKIGSHISHSLSDLEELNNKSAQYNFIGAVNKGSILAIILSILLILYASLAAPKLPKSVVKLFNNTIAKIIFIFLMLIVAGIQPLFSIIISICILIMIQLLAYYESSDRIMNIINKSNSQPVEKINISDEDKVSGNDNKQLYSVIQNQNEDEENKKYMPETQLINSSNEVIGYSDPDFALYN